MLVLLTPRSETKNSAKKFEFQWNGLHGLCVMEKIKLGVIGGSGLYDLPGLEVLREVKPQTPWGEPSDVITVGHWHGQAIAFLPRHGRGHFLTPTEVPAQANIAALKHLGVEVILAFSAVGSLREEIVPLHFVLPSQIIDRTCARPSSFFGNGVVAHVPFAQPFSPYLAQLVELAAHELSIPLHTDKTLICMEGPQFSTQAESHLYRSWGADIINMSVLPEAKLAREAEIHYQMVCMATDYDCWREDEASVTVEMVIGNLIKNAGTAQRLLQAILPKFIASDQPSLVGSTTSAIVTAPEKRNPEQIARLRYLFPV